jgi:hypothetical protein
MKTLWYAEALSVKNRRGTPGFYIETFYNLFMGIRIGFFGHSFRPVFSVWKLPH